MKWPQTLLRDLRIKAAPGTQCRQNQFKDIIRKCIFWYQLGMGQYEILTV